MSRGLIFVVAVLAAGCSGSPASSQTAAPSVETTAGSTVTPVLTSVPARTPLPTATATATPTIAPVSPAPTPTAPGPSGTPNGSAACTDDAFVLATDVYWPDGFEWWLNISSVPAQYDRTKLEAIVKRSFANVTDAVNDCGLPDGVAATATFMGYTNEKACEPTTDRNVVGFGPIPGNPSDDTIAETCTYGSDELAAFAHIVISPDEHWALSVDTCEKDQEMLEATLTHEVGHVFGLEHVAERRHGDLTMSTRSNGPCHNEEATLGLGDILGLEELYPTD